MLSDHEKYHPPVKHIRLELNQNISNTELFKKIELPTSVTIEKILWHQGFFLNRKRLEKIPNQFKAKDEIDIYYFEREPLDLNLEAQTILWQGDGIIAVNKPAWLPTQGSRVSTRFSFEEKVRELTGLKYLNALHRLDRQTSGLVLFATNLEAERYYMKQFHDQKIQKTYLAYVFPKSQKEEWEVSGYLKKNFKKLPLNIYKLFKQEEKNSKFSHTKFRVLQTTEDFSLVEAKPLTGRTHQIRVHLSYSGCPIIGDELYGGRRNSSSRILLHASEIQINYLSKKKISPLTLKAPLPNDFKIIHSS